MARIKLNLGCGIYVKKGWINVDKYLTEKGLKSKKGEYKNSTFEKGAKFVQADVAKMPFPDNYADLAEAHELLEHLALIEVIPAMKEIYRVLKPGGKFIAHCPSFDGLALDWLDMTVNQDLDLKQYQDIADTIYGNQVHDGEFHKTPFNVKFMNYCLVQAGFVDGVIGVYKKGIKTPKMGEFTIPHDPNRGKTVLRNDTIYVEVTK